jgi:hypothetical protein
MIRTERRSTPRYTPLRNLARLGWWEGTQFRSIPARLHNISIGGAALSTEEDRPEAGSVWVCLATQDAPEWVRAEIVGVYAADEIHIVRLSFPDICPYEVFKSAVWGRLTGPVPAPTAPPVVGVASEAYASAQYQPSLPDCTSTNPDRTADPTPGGSSLPAPSRSAFPVPSPPTLIEAQHAQWSLHDRMTSLGWLVLFVISITMMFLIGVVAAEKSESVRQFETVLEPDDTVPPQPAR